MQLINNQIIMSPAPSDTHQKVKLKISANLFLLVEKNEWGEVRDAPYDVYLNDENIYQPDIVFIKKENIGNITEKGYHGAPDMVIEVLSPSNAADDKKGKKDVYEQEGVKEYFIVEPYDKIVSHYLLQNGRFELLETTVGMMASKIIDAVIRF